MGDILIFKKKSVIQPNKKTKSQLKLEYIANRINDVYKNIEDIHNDRFLQLKLISLINQLNQINIYAISEKEFILYNELQDQLEMIISYEKKRIRLSRFKLIKCS
jgi:hypothetical protein